VRDNVVRVVAVASDLDAAIDEAASKVTRQLRKYKTRIVDKRQRAKRPEPVVENVSDLADLIAPAQGEDEDDELVREKVVELKPMSVEEALVQIDLIGHDFYMFEDSRTGLTNVVYRRKNGGYGIIKPKIEDEDEQA
jgi:putative sigma-54 modulation protein